jgi:hypothetical protein
LAGAAGTLLLQGGLFLLFLSSMPKILPPLSLGREMILRLPRLRPAPPPPVPARGPPSIALPVPLSPPIATAPAPLFAPPPAADLHNFGQALNGCAPENYSSLTPDRQARCRRPGEGVAVPQAPNLMGSPDHVKDEAHWETELARKQSPLLLPCFEPINGITSFNFVCLATRIAKGELTDPRSWSIYETKQLAPNELYKIEQAYDTWHKQHPDSPPQDAHALR